MPKTTARLNQEIAEFLSGGDESSAPITARQAAFVKREVEGKTDGTVQVETMDDGHRLIVDDPTSGHHETFGVSRYGITPGSVRFGDKYREGDKFIKILRAAIKKADQVTPRAPRPAKAKKPKATIVATSQPRSNLDLTRVPGTPGDQRMLAGTMLARRRKPIRIQHAGTNDWRVIVLDVDIGSVASEALARSAAHQVGRYRLDLGDFVDSYVDDGR